MPPFAAQTLWEETVDAVLPHIGRLMAPSATKAAPTRETKTDESETKAAVAVAVAAAPPPPAAAAPHEQIRAACGEASARSVSAVVNLQDWIRA